MASRKAPSSRPPWNEETRRVRSRNPALPSWLEARFEAALKSLAEGLTEERRVLFMVRDASIPKPAEPPQDASLELLAAVADRTEFATEDDTWLERRSSQLRAAAEAVDRIRADLRRGPPPPLVPWTVLSGSFEHGGGLVFAKEVLRVHAQLMLQDAWQNLIPGLFKKGMGTTKRETIIIAHRASRLDQNQASLLAADLAARLLHLPADVVPLLSTLGIAESREQLRLTKREAVELALLKAIKRWDDEAFAHPERTSIVLMRALGGHKRRCIHLFDYRDKRAKRSSKRG